MACIVFVCVLMQAWCVTCLCELCDVLCGVVWLGVACVFVVVTR